jgi:DNA-binding LacI/PurR family transcriptional regulator
MCPSAESPIPSARKIHKRSTMKDVAALVSVSVQTVSAVINGKPGITEETSIRVREAIKRLGYQPDYTARSLRSGRRRTIALFVSNVADSVLGIMASAAEDYAFSEQYNLVLYNTHDDPEREMSYVNTAAQGSVDGVLFVAATQPHKARESLERAGIPSVVVDRIPEGYGGPSVGLDNIKAGDLAAEHLLELGHTRLAHIASPVGVRLSRERQEGFVQSIERAGTGTKVSVETVRDWGYQPGYEAMQRLLRRTSLPTAVFSATDHAAIGAMHAIREAGMRIPGEISIVGMDDVEAAAFQNPSLTSVNQSLAQMAGLGVQMLLDILGGTEPAEPRIVLQPTLVVRGSTAPPRGR